jgi:hypothetical protein
MQNLQPGLWGWGNLIKNKRKKDHKVQFITNSIYKVEIEKQINKRDKERPTNPSKPTKPRYPNHANKITQWKVKWKQSWSSILKLTQYWRMKHKRRLNKKMNPKKYLSQSSITCQTRGLAHEIKIIL